MKETISTAVGFAAGLLSWLVGGFDTPVLALVVCMAVDYVTGLLVAGVFHSSPKTASGGLDSRVGWKGLARKFVTMLMVVVANLADALWDSAASGMRRWWDSAPMSASAFWKMQAIWASGSRRPCGRHWSI